VRGATYLPTAWIHSDLLIDLLTRQTWKAAPIAQFTQQPTTPSQQSHHDRADLRQAIATHRAEVARDWQTHRLEPHDRTAIWEVARLLPTTAIEIVPRLSSTKLSVEQCAAIADMMHRPIVPNNETDLIAGIFTAWGELFRSRVVRVWSKAQLSCKTLTVSLELRSIPLIHTSGFAELHGDHFYVAASWGLPHILDAGLIEPDRLDLDLASASIRAQTLGQKPYGYTLQTTHPGSSSLGFTLQQVSPERQAHFALQSNDLLALIQLARSVRHWQHPALAAGMRIDWSFGSHVEQIPISIDADPVIDHKIDHKTDRGQWLEANSAPSTKRETIAPTDKNTSSTARDLFVHDISPLNCTRPSFWFADALNTHPPQPICTAIWHGSSASGGRVTASAFVFKPPSESKLDTIQPLKRTDPEPGEIWVCTKIPAMRLRDLRHAAGLVIEAGSSTSHEVLLARDLGLPIVVGVVGIVEALNTGDRLEIDANIGEVMLYSDLFSPVRLNSDHNVSQREVLPQPQTILDDQTSELAASIAVTESQPQTAIQTATQAPTQTPTQASPSPDKVQRQIDLRVNLSYLERNLPLDKAWGGIGILRSEMLAFTEGVELTLNPTPREQGALHRWLHQRLTLAIELCEQRTVFYRVFDRLSPDATLIDRGMHLYLDRPSLFDIQLNVLAELHQNGHTQIRLLLPFVRSRAELEFCWQRLDRLGLDRANSSIEVWIMAEVPSVLMLLDEYCQLGISGIAIGTNDLTSLLLGIDREDGRSTAIAKAARPALHAAILTLAATANRHGLACQLCYDDIVNDPETLADFLRAGVTALSVGVDYLSKAEQAIAVSLGSNGEKRQPRLTHEP
jgi:pyruvate,water dikinase